MPGEIKSERLGFIDLGYPPIQKENIGASAMPEADPALPCIS